MFTKSVFTTLNALARFHDIVYFLYPSLVWVYILFIIHMQFKDSLLFWVLGSDRRVSVNNVYIITIVIDGNIDVQQHDFYLYFLNKQ